MSITTLQIRNFRNLSEVSFSPCAGINILWGENGSGKTSLLEAIHCLGLGRSFRTASAARLIQHRASQFNLFAEIYNAEQQITKIGIERGIESSRIRIAEKDIKNISELAVLLPIRVINSNSHQLFEGGPAFRRKYLDWGTFYHNANFLSAWRFFERSLKQRNTLLRQKSPKNEIDTWSKEVAKYSYKLNDLRKNYLYDLIPDLQIRVLELLGIEGVEAFYYPGWQDVFDYTVILEKYFLEDYRLGVTQRGPHKADLELKLENILLQHFLSRGQQKLLICAMIIAQGMTFSRAVSKRLIYLIDDLPAELDKTSRERLIALLAAQDSQVFITAIEGKSTAKIASAFKKPLKVFHVKHGQINEDEG